MNETMDETIAQCCKVCGLYKCKVHTAWVVCANCPSNGKYDPAVHSECPYCGNSPKARSTKGPARRG